MTAATPQTKRRFVPNTYVIIFIMIVLAAVMTWIIPAGQFDRTVNEAGRTIVVAGSYHQVESSPVGPIGVFFAIEQGLIQTGMNLEENIAYLKNYIMQ